MRFDDVLEKLAESKKQVFTTYDAAKIMGKKTPYASLLLGKSKKVTRIERGVYFINGAGAYEIASNVVFPSYVSLQAGLQFYGLIDQNVVRYSVIALKRHREITVNNMSIEFIRAPRKMFFGYVNKADAYVATPAKLFVDCLYFGNVTFSTLKDALETARDEQLIDPELVKRHAVQIGSGTLVNRLGFLMEESGINADGLLKYRYGGRVTVHGSGNRGVNRKWRVSYD